MLGNKTHTHYNYKPDQSNMASAQWPSNPLSLHYLHFVLSHSLSLPLQFVVCLPVSPSPPPIMRWCLVVVSTWPVWQSVLPCLLSSGWVARRSWPGRRRCRLDAMSSSSPTSSSRPTTPVWPYPHWGSSRPPPRSLSKVGVAGKKSLNWNDCGSNKRWEFKEINQKELPDAVIKYACGLLLMIIGSFMIIKIVKSA